MKRSLSFLAYIAAMNLFAPATRAELTRIEITSRAELALGQTFGSSGSYERLTGKAYFTSDPRNSHNRVIVDLDKAPRNAHGQVEFSADIVIVKPKEMSKGNGAVLFEVSNRGGKGMESFFNHSGDGFLYRQGYTLVWLGWQFDVPRQEGLLRLYTPVATDKGKPITGVVRSEVIVPVKRNDFSLADRGHIPYPVLDPQSADNVMTVRSGVEEAGRTVPRTDWQFARDVGGQPVADNGSVYLKGGFEPGKIYEIVYRAANPSVTGLGLAGVRDLISAFKYDPNAIVSAPRAYGFGISQSGRFLRHFLYQGFNSDEKGRKVFDGVMAHVGGAGRGGFNLRFAQPSRDGLPFFNLFYPADVFPFTDVEQYDPETGIRDGLLTHARDAKNLPKIFYTNTSFEYYGRAASLIHTSVDGKHDAPIGENTRIYFFAGGQHFAGPFPPAIIRSPDLLARNPSSPLDVTWSMRALLIAMDRWVKDGTPPPPSRYPKIADGTLTPLDKLAFPKLPGIELPKRPHFAYRVDYGPEFNKGIITVEPPRVGMPFQVMVPQVDEDGIDRAGIHLPEITVPLATYTGWNLRDPSTGAPEELASFVGSYLPFAFSSAERASKGDPRRSIEERYSGKEEYLARFKEAIRQLVVEGYLLSEDTDSILKRGADHWDYSARQSRKN
jgi:hypothetical protein